MSTYDKILKKGKTEGLIEGKIEGKIEAYAEKDRAFVTSLILNTDFDNAKIANLASVAEEFGEKLRQGLSQ